MSGQAIVCEHARDCRCPSCLEAWAEWHWLLRTLDADPERDTARAEFAAWVESQDAAELAEAVK